MHARIRAQHLAGLEDLLEPPQVALDLGAGEQPRQLERWGAPEHPELHLDPDLGHVAPGRPGERHAPTGLDLAALDRAPRQRLAGAILDDLGLPAHRAADRQPGGPPRAPVGVLLDRGQVAHELGQLLEPPPELVDLHRRLVDRHRRDHRQRMPGVAPAARRHHVERRHPGDHPERQGEPALARSGAGQRQPEQAEVDRVADHPGPARRRMIGTDKHRGARRDLADAHRAQDRRRRAVAVDPDRVREQPGDRQLGDAQGDAEPAEPSNQTGCIHLVLGRWLAPDR